MIDKFTGIIIVVLLIALAWNFHHRGIEGLTGMPTLNVGKPMAGNSRCGMCALMPTSAKCIACRKLMGQIKGNSYVDYNATLPQIVANDTINSGNGLVLVDGDRTAIISGAVANSNANSVNSNSIRLERFGGRGRPMIVDGQFIPAVGSGIGSSTVNANGMYDTLTATEAMRKMPIEEACRRCRELPASKYCEACVDGQVQKIVYQDPSGQTYDIRNMHRV